MRNFFLVFALLSLSASTGAIAQQQQPQQRSGTPEEQKACAHDVQKYCRTVMNQDDLTVLACLQQNRPKLTHACNQVLVNHGQYASQQPSPPPRGSLSANSDMIWNLRETADGIGFGTVFPYMGFAIRDVCASLRTRAKPKNVASS